MISISKDDGGVDVIFKAVKMHRFYRACSANRHENGRWDAPMTGFYSSGPGFGIVILLVEGEKHGGKGKRNRLPAFCA